MPNTATAYHIAEVYFDWIFHRHMLLILWSPADSSCPLALSFVRMTYSQGWRQCWLRNCAREEEPGRPRSPKLRALLTRFQVSPGASWIGPEAFMGHCPVRI